MKNEKSNVLDKNLIEIRNYLLNMKNNELTSIIIFKLVIYYLNLFIYDHYHKFSFDLTHFK